MGTCNYTLLQASRWRPEHVIYSGIEPRGCIILADNTLNKDEENTEVSVGYFAFKR